MPSNEEEPEVPVHCPECETTTQIPLSDVGESIESHNDQLHDGEDIAGVDPDLAEQFADLVAEDLGLLK